MRDERYSIEVGDDYVEIHGDLTIEETFDFLNFFEKKGFRSVTGGWENSTLVMSRRGVEEKWEEIRKKEHIDSEAMYENLYTLQQEKEKSLNRRIDELESLMRVMFSDESDKVQKLRKENDVLIKKLKMINMEENEEVKKLLEGFAYRAPEVVEETE